MALQAFLDDSGTKGTGTILLIGGLLGSAESIAQIADNWMRELTHDSSPSPLAYFKSYEARHCSGQFNRWSRKQRDAKVRRLAAVIDRDDVVMIFCSVDLGAHRHTEQAVGKVVDTKKHPLNQPYLMALLTVLMASGLEAWHRKSDQKVEVVVDEHVIFRRDALRQWDMMLEIVPAWLREWMPIQPLFRDDKNFVALQAADLLMGHARMTVERTSRWPDLEFKKLMASPFSDIKWAQPLGEIAARRLEAQYGLPKNSLQVSVTRSVSGV